MGGHSKFKTSIRRSEPSTPSDCGPSSIHSLGIHVIAILFQFTAKCPSPIPRSPRGVGQAKVRLPRHVRPHLDCSSDRCVPAPLRFFGRIVGASVFWVSSAIRTKRRTTIRRRPDSLYISIIPFTDHHIFSCIKNAVESGSQNAPSVVGLSAQHTTTGLAKAAPLTGTGVGLGLSPHIIPPPPTSTKLGGIQGVSAPGGVRASLDPSKPEG